MIGKSWWIKGDTIIPVDHHLEYLQEHPQQFGLIINKLKTVIANAKAQGKDVKEDVIINYALVNGWIRVRKNPQYWSFNVRGFRQRRKDIVNFCYDMTMEKKMSENDSMKILDFTDGKTYNYYYQQGGVKAFLAESKKKGINPMKEKQEKSQKREARRIGGAWWFRGKGSKPIDVGTGNHIGLMISKPEIFHLTKEEIDEAYKTTGEPVGMEGKAREFLIDKVVRNGWIRIRHYIGGRDYWSFTINDFKSRRSDLVDFCWWAITEDLMTEHDDISILSLKDNQMYNYSYMQGGVKSFLNEKKKNNSMLKSLLTRYKSIN